MRCIEHVVNGVFLEFCKLAFDSIEPGGIRWSPDKNHFVLTCPTTYFSSAMRREVIQNEEDRLTAGILLAHPLQCLEHFLRTFPLGEVAPEQIAMNVKERQKMSHTVRASVGRRQAMGMPTPCPALPEVRAQFQRSELVETDNAGTLRNPPI